MNMHQEKPFIRNKAAQVLALTFVREYLTHWPKFFFDILTLIGLNPHGVDIYLRTLMAIDAEVVDRDIMHSHEVTTTGSTNTTPTTYNSSSSVCLAKASKVLNPNVIGM